MSDLNLQAKVILFQKGKIGFSVLQIGLYDKSFVDIQRDKIKVFTTFLVKKSLSKKQKKILKNSNITKKGKFFFLK